MKKLMFQEGDKYGNLTFCGYTTDIEDEKFVVYGIVVIADKLFSAETPLLKLARLKVVVVKEHTI